MEHRTVVLSEGTYNMEGSLKVPHGVSITGRARLWRRVIGWIQSIWRKSLIIVIVRVAAIDSSDEDKAKADYICDGIRDEIEIQAALETAQSRLK